MIKPYPGLTAKQSRVLRHTGHRLAIRTEKIVAEKKPILKEKAWAGLIWTIRYLFRSLWTLLKFAWRHKKEIAILIIAGLILWVLYWRISQGFTTEDQFFLIVGLAFLFIGLRFTLRVWRERAFRHVYIGASTMLGGALMFYLGFL